MGYLVLAYPEIADSDYNSIQNYRREHDELYFTVVKPHFTLVFPVFDIDETSFIEEVINKAKDVHQIYFTIRSSTINKDAFNSYYHTFLVPDEGNSQMIKLHDRLYSGLLKINHRLDIDFIPHIGIGNSKDQYACKRMVDEWNAKEFEIQGTINELTIVSFENNKVLDLHTIYLKS